MDALPRVTGATLDVLEVLLSAQEPTWGLRVIAATGRPAGSVYPILARLEQRGWVTSAWEDEDRRGPRRRLYTLTEEAAEPAQQILEQHRRSAPAAATSLDWRLT